MASYRLLIKPSAAKELERTPLDIRRRIVIRMEKLSGDPRPSGSQKLGARDIYRVRQGDYRILYEVNDRTRTVTVFKIGHRSEVYR